MNAPDNLAAMLRPLLETTNARCRPKGARDGLLAVRTGPSC